jgi:hypothetical protein
MDKRSSQAFDMPNNSFGNIDVAGGGVKRRAAARPHAAPAFNRKA